MPTLLAQLNPFEAAMQTLARRKALPTNLGSAALRQLGAAFHADNLVSARHSIIAPLETLRDSVGSILNPSAEQRADRVTETNPQGNVTTGLNPASARLAIKQALKDAGFAPDPKDAGTIKDLSSDARINLQIKTNVERHQGAGFAIQSNDPAVLEAFPCWELYRLETRKTQRDWPTRWRLCAQVVGDTDALRVLAETGEMIARLDSPIWQALGDGEDGSNDTLGNPYPPFAYSSGMWTRLVPYDKAERLGFVNLNTVVQSNLPDDLAQLFGVAA